MLKVRRPLTTHSRKIFKWISGKSYSVFRPGMVTPPRNVPRNIPKPEYITHQIYPNSTSPLLKTDEEINHMHEVCQLARRILDQTAASIQPGISTEEIDEILHDLVIKNEAYPSPLLYRGFPKSCCTSVNNVALHGIPDDRILQNGDIINLDVTIYKNGYHGDLSETYCVGDVDSRSEILVQTTEKSLNKALNVCGPGVKLNKIGQCIEQVFQGSGMSVIPQICGHGIGRGFHEAPDIVHVDYETDTVMVPGMVFTIEPCISEGAIGIELLEDGWTYVSVDNSRSAQFEHTVAVTRHGIKVLTMK